MTSQETSAGKPKSLQGLWLWFIRDFLGIIGEMRWSYVPPLMVYFAAGISGFTGIVESFYVKEQLGLSASNLLTSYLNRIFIVERGDFSELGLLMLTTMLIGLLFPLLTVLLVRCWQRTLIK